MRDAGTSSKLASDATEAESVVSVVVVLWVDVCGVEVQVASVLTGVHRTGPVVAVAACVQQGATIDAARPSKAPGQILRLLGENRTLARIRRLVDSMCT